jgi:AccI restriction endonuclease
MASADQTESLFRDKFEQEREAIARLSSIDPKVIGAGSAGNLKLLREISTRGLTQALGRRRSEARKEEINRLVREFILFGAKAVLLTGVQRGGDFLNNQLRGQWAERVTLSMQIEGLHLVNFGPSGAAMPGERDHREVVMTFREIHLLEGKRPDLLAFDQPVWDHLTRPEQLLVSQWPTRRLEGADELIVKKARCGIEVKNSTWHYGTRRSAGGGPLSITVKKEEVADIQNWSLKTQLPVIFVQVLFDELYCMSFRRMVAAIERGYLYVGGDYVLDEQSGEKVYHKFHLSDMRHFCGKVVFPSDSKAVVRVLGDGNVVPYIDYQPAQTTDVIPQVISGEIAYMEPAMPSANPPTQTP